MKLFNKTIDRQLFKQYSLGSDLSKQEVVVKIFNPQGAGTWFILNSDPQDPDYLWAIVDLGYGAEVGSVSRNDLETYRGRFGLGFERDLGFDPINAEELYQGLRNGEYYADGGQIEVVYERSVGSKKPIKLLLLNKGKEQKGYTFSGKDQVAVLENYNRNKQEDLERLWNLKGYESKYADGGDIAEFSDNQQMIMNQNVEVEHHHEELEDILEDKIPVPAWVVAKMETATQNLSDITHYLDGQKEIMEDQLEEDDDDDDDDDDEMEMEEIENKEVVEPIVVTAGDKTEITKNFTDDAWDNLRGFLKGMEGIDLRDDYTFDYKDEQFEVEPIINSDENGVSNAVFTIFDGDGEEVGDISYSREGGKQKFTANSEFFSWNNAKFENGGFMNGVYAKGGIVDAEKVNKADEIYREHNRERKEKGIENFSKESVALWNEKYKDRLEKLKLTLEEKNALNPKKWYADGGYFDGAIPKTSSYMSTYANGGLINAKTFDFLKKHTGFSYTIEEKPNGRISLQIQEDGSKSYAEIYNSTDDKNVFYINSVSGNIGDKIEIGKRWYGDTPYNLNGVKLWLKERGYIKEKINVIKNYPTTYNEYISLLTDYEPLQQFAEFIGYTYPNYYFDNDNRVYTNYMLPQYKYFNVKGYLEPIFWNNFFQKLFKTKDIAGSFTLFGTQIGTKSNGNYGSQQGFINSGEQYLLNLDIEDFDDLLDIKNWHQINDKNLEIDSKFIKDIEDSSKNNFKIILNKIVLALKNDKEFQNYLKTKDSESVKGKGLKSGDSIVESFDKYVKVKTKENETVYVVLTTGERTFNLPTKFADGGGIGFIPMDLEKDLALLAKWGGTNIKGVIGILNAMIDSGVTNEDLIPKPTKNTHFQLEKATEKKIQEIWNRIKPNYKGDFEGNMYYSTLKEMISRNWIYKDVLAKFKPFRKYQKDSFADGGQVRSFDGIFGKEIIFKEEQVGKFTIGISSGFNNRRHVFIYEGEVGRYGGKGLPKDFNMSPQLSAEFADNFYSNLKRKVENNQDLTPFELIKEVKFLFADGGFMNDVYAKGGSVKKDWWQTVVNPNEDFHNYDNRKPIDWEVDDFKEWVVSNSDLDGNVDKEVLDVIKMPKSKLTVEYLNKNGSGKNNNEYYKEFGNWQSALYDIFTQMKKDYLFKKSRKYILKADIKTVTVKRKGKEVTYNGSDVLNGAYVLAKGGDMTSKANYVGKNDVVEVELKDGSKVKPANGYWIKKGAEPIGAEPMTTTSGKLEPKIGQTQIGKGSYGWKATTNVDDFNGHDWKISTFKTSRGELATSAQGGKINRENGYSTFKFIVFEDPYHTLEVSKPSRLTEKVVTEQHEKALAKFKKFMETGTFKGGGKISNFDKLSAKVAKNYEGKPVKSQYQEEYGKYYSKEEAQEVGDKVAGKVKAMQPAKKEMGGGTKKATSGSEMLKQANILAKEIRKDGESWNDAKKRAFAQLKK
jgi:hypothetical protein